MMPAAGLSAKNSAEVPGDRVGNDRTPCHRPLWQPQLEVRDVDGIFSRARPLRGKCRASVSALLCYTSSHDNNRLVHPGPDAWNDATGGILRHVGGLASHLAGRPDSMSEGCRRRLSSQVPRVLLVTGSGLAQPSPADRPVGTRGRRDFRVTALPTGMERRPTIPNRT
jgi:hypothetical protein